MFPVATCDHEWVQGRKVRRSYKSDGVSLRIRLMVRKEKVSAQFPRFEFESLLNAGHDYV
jgi:hypothetical protein